jgi:four helix bundle protein
MVFDHEKLDVYRLSVEFAAWAFQLSAALNGPDRHARDQLLRASQSVPLNIAEGNGKRTSADRARFFRIASGSALECAAVLDVLLACGSIPAARCEEGKAKLHRIVGMLSRLAARSEGVAELPVDYAETSLGTP